MSAQAVQRPKSPTRSLDRICKPKKDATDEARVICLFNNYLRAHHKKPRKPSEGKHTGFMQVQRDGVSDLVHFETVKPSSKFAKTVGFSAKVAKIDISIRAWECPRESEDETRVWMTSACVAVFDSHGKRLAESNPGVIMEHDWSNMTFAEVMERLQWACKVIFDSSGEQREGDGEDRMRESLGLYKDEEKTTFGL